MKNYLYAAIAIALIVITVYSLFQTEFDRTGRMDIVFYNVENLFDTMNDPDTWDDEFTPDSTKKWTTERYDKKLQDLAKIISSVSEQGLPEVVGLCEIENRKVVQDLFHTDSLSRRKYKVIHEESPDRRGIDVALVYDREVMEELHHEAIRYSFSFEPRTTTRDILYAKMLADRDTLHFFVNHWPSRRGGMEKSEPKQIGRASCRERV